MANQILSPPISQNGNGKGLPEFLRAVVADEKPAVRTAVAEQAVLALNSSMLRLYDESLAKFQHNLLNRVPVILALFTGAGGQLILYSPGQPPEVAPPVPIVYQLAKSVGHSTMAIYQVVVPYLNNPKANQLWRRPLQAYRLQNQAAFDSLSDLDISEADRAVVHAILQRNLAFMDECLTAGTFTYEGVENFVRDCAPHSINTIGIGSTAQDRFSDASTPHEQLANVRPSIQSAPADSLDQGANHGARTRRAVFATAAIDLRIACQTSPIVERTGHT